MEINNAADAVTVQRAKLQQDIATSSQKTSNQAAESSSNTLSAAISGNDYTAKTAAQPTPPSFRGQNLDITV